MKFENDFIRIEIEKKELTEEQRQSHRVKWKKRRPYAVTAAVLTVVILSGVLYGHYHKSSKPDVFAVAEQEDVPETGWEKEDIETDIRENVNGGVQSPEQTKEEEILADADYVTSVHLAVSAKEKYKDITIYDLSLIHI